MSIPIQNIYYLLCYAWNHLPESSVIDVSSVDSTQLADLYACVLIGGTNHLLRRGLDRGYVAQAEDTSCLRGKIDIGFTAKRLLLHQAKAHCRFDEFEHNILHNRILKTTIRRISAVKGLDPAHREKLIHLYHLLTGIDETPLSGLTFRQVQLHRNNSFYRFLMKACELVVGCLLVDEKSGECKFRDILRDEMTMSSVFEDFVRNFYRIEQTTFQVPSPITIYWDAEDMGKGHREFLPRMRTDVTLRNSERLMIIDTKYYADTLQEHHGKRTVRSNNLYQLFAYLKNVEKQEPLGEKAEGMLLYPTVAEALDLHYRIQGHSMRVCTINLAQDWHEIKSDLLGLLNIPGRLPTTPHCGST